MFGVEGRDEEFGGGGGGGVAVRIMEAVGVPPLLYMQC